MKIKSASEQMRELFTQMAHDLYDQSKDESKPLTIEKYLDEITN